MIKKIHIRNRVRIYLKGKEIIVNQILLSELCYIVQVYIFPKIYQKANGKNLKFPLERTKKVTS